LMTSYAPLQQERVGRARPASDRAYAVDLDPEVKGTIVWR
jgi:hypothetical protein